MGINSSSYSSLATFTFLGLLITGLFPMYGVSGESIENNVQEKVINWAYKNYFGEANSPTDSTSVYSQDYMASIYNGLMKRTIASDRAYVNDLAASMPIVSSDYKNWTFTLRPDLKFSDGSDLNASSVVFSYKVHLTQSIDVGYKVFFPSSTDKSFSADDYSTDKSYFTNDSIYEIDNLRIQFNMTQTNVFAPSLFSQWIYSEDHFGPQYDDCLADVTACDWNTDLTGGNLKGGSGPFIMDKYDTTNNFIELVPNPYYYNANKIKIDKIVIRTIFYAIDAKDAFAAGETNIYDSRYKSKATDFFNFVGVTDVFVGTSGIQEMIPNHNHQYFGLGNYTTTGANARTDFSFRANQTAARNIRKAMSHMINRVFIANEITGGLGSPAATIMPKISIGFDETILPRAYNQDVAKAFMEDAGFDYTGKTFDSNTGALNEPFFEISVISPLGNADREQWAALIVQELPKIGIGVKAHETGGFGCVYCIPNRTYRYPGPPPDYDHGGYDLYFVGWSFGLDFNPIGLYEFEFQNPSCCNVYNYNNITTETAIATYVAELDATARLPLVKRVQELLHDDLPSFPIVNAVDHWVWSNQINGLDGLSMSQRLFEWELVDIDFTISGVTSNPIETEFVETTVTTIQNIQTSSDDLATEELPSSVNLSFLKMYVVISALFTIILMKKRKNKFHMNQVNS